MAEQSRAGLAWASRVAFLRDAVTRANDFADLLAAVEPRWHAALQAVNSDVELRILPAGDTINRAFCLRIGRSKTGFPMELTRRESLTNSAVVARSRATVQNAPGALARMLGMIFGQSEMTSSEAEGELWDGIVGSFRACAAEDAAKAELLESVGHAMRARCEIYDNGQVFEIIRIGDIPENGEGIWISQVNGGWSLCHRAQTPQGGSSRTIREVTAHAKNAGETLNGLLEAMVSGMPPPELSAQDAYSQLLRDHLTPALRHDGYKGSGGHFHRAAGEYQVLIQFQKSKFSTRARVDYRLNISVLHPATAEHFSQANREAHALGREYEAASAGTYHNELPKLLRDGRQWISLRPDEDLETHATMLLADIRNVAYPAVKEQLCLPLPTPTPPAGRASRPSRDALNKQMLESLLPRLQAAGVEISDSPDQLFKN